MARRTEAGLELQNRASLFQMPVNEYLKYYNGDVVHDARAYRMHLNDITGSSETNSFRISPISLIYQLEPKNPFIPPESGLLHYDENRYRDENILSP